MLRSKSRDKGSKLLEAGCVIGDVFVVDQPLADEDDARGRIFLERIDWTSLEAVRAEAVVAAHGQVVAVGVGPRATLDLANAPPAEIGGIAILLIAGHLTGAAANALRHVEMEAILLSRLEWALRNERRPDLGCRRSLREDFEPIFRQSNDGVRCVGLREFLERQRHSAFFHFSGSVRD